MKSSSVGSYWYSLLEGRTPWFDSNEVVASVVIPYSWPLFITLSATNWNNVLGNNVGKAHREREFYNKLAEEVII